MHFYAQKTMQTPGFERSEKTQSIFVGTTKVIGWNHLDDWSKPPRWFLTNSFRGLLLIVLESLIWKRLGVWLDSLHSCAIRIVWI